MDCLGGRVNKTIQTSFFVSYILVLDALNGAKRAKNIAKRGQKYKIVNFEASLAFEVL